MNEDDQNTNMLPQGSGEGNPDMGTTMDSMMAEFFAELDEKLDRIETKLDQIIGAEASEENGER